MKIKSLISIAILCILSGVAVYANADEGLISKKSNYSVKETLDRLAAALEKKGIKVVARINHGANAKKVDMNLRATELLIFGNPKLGTPLLNSNQTVGIDLPMKALAWEDEKGQVWLTYNDPAYITSRHGISDKDEVKNKMAGALDKLTSAATGN